MSPAHGPVAEGHRNSLYFAVIGTHVRGKSASPAMHKASFKALGIDAEYIALDVPRESFATATASALKS